MFRATNSSILRSTFDYTYNFGYNAPILLPTDATVEMELHRVPSQTWSAAVSVHCTKSCIYSHKSAPEDGRIYRPKHVGLIKKDE